MKKSIAELQIAFQAITNSLKRNKKVRAVFTYGSIVSGDIWEGSDIDIFIVYEDEYDEIRDIFSESKGVPVHAKVLSREEFIELDKVSGNKGIIRDLMAKSKMVFSKDAIISEIYNRSRYSNDSQLEKWNLVYLGNIISDLGVCKKYLINGGLNTSYEVLMRVLDGVAKLYINLNGYEKTKDSVVMASNLSHSIENVVTNLFNSKVTIKVLQETIDYVDTFIQDNLIEASKLLLEYLSNQEVAVSAYELTHSELFSEFNIKIEFILKELSTRGYVIQEKRPLYDSSGIRIMKEYVYKIKS